MRRLIWLLPFAIASGAHLAVKLAGMAEADAASKWFLMPALLASLAIAVATGVLRPSRLTAALVGGALLLSWVGDVTLHDVLVGLSFFFGAQLCYIAAFWREGRGRPSWWSLLVLPWLGALLLVLAPTAGALLPAVIAYGLVLAAMAVSSTRVGGRAVLGAALFVLSDTLLALRLFTDQLQGRPADALIIATYLVAQLLLATGLLEPAGRRSAPAAPPPAAVRDAR